MWVPGSMACNHGHLEACTHARHTEAVMVASSQSVKDVFMLCVSLVALRFAGHHHATPQYVALRDVALGDVPTSQTPASSQAPRSALQSARASRRCRLCLPPLPVPGGKVHTLGDLASTWAPRSAMRCAYMRQPPLPPTTTESWIFQELQTRRDRCPGAHCERTATLPYPAESAPQHACASRR